MFGSHAGFESFPLASGASVAAKSWEDGVVIDVAVAWLMANPLQAVAAMAGVGIAVGLLLVPALHEVTGHGHPRL